MKQSQRGYLLLMAIVLLMIMGVLSVNMLAISSTNSNAMVATTLETQAYYVAESGINMAQRYWHRNLLACDAITGSQALTNVSFSPGMFTVTATSVQNNSSLSAAISDADTTIPMVSTSGFPSKGAITIASEGIYYTGISGNSLTGAVRGAGSTVAAAQSSGAAVTQSECILTATGAVNNLTSPAAQRTLQSTMFSFPATSSNVIGSIAAIGRVTLQNGSVTNGHACLSCSNYPGSNVQTNNTNNNSFTSFSTQVDANAADGGNLTTSSYDGSIMPDILEGTTFTNSTLYSTYFSKSTAYIQANASYVGRDVLNRTGVIYANGNVNISNGSLGTPSNPVLMYVDGNLRMTSVSVYGLIYATGNVTLTNLSMQGAIATESRFDMTGVGFTYNYSMLSAMTTNPTYSEFMNASSITGGGGETPNPYPANVQEVFG